jgi:hypothetical protein
VKKKTHRPIVIEGPDGMGKTVLANQLARQFGYSHKRCGPAPIRPVDLLYWVDRQEKQLRQRKVILDRMTCISSYVYGSLSTHYSYESIELYMERSLKSALLHNPIFILCIASEVRHQPEEYDTLLDSEELLEKLAVSLIPAYRERFTSLGIPYIEYDWMKDGALKALIDQLEGQLICQ